MMNVRQIDNRREKELLLRLKDGDHNAFEEIYHLYKDKLIGNLLRMLKSRELVEELVQELFLKIWNGRQEIDPENSFKAYLFRIAANMTKNIFRSMYYDKQMRSTLLPVEERVYTHIEEHIVSQENKKILDNLLDKLPSQRRMVFTLCKLEGKSYREVGELLNISENTVNDHIRKANLTLRKLSTDPEIMGLLLAGWLCFHI